ncbi:acyltransferase family protein [Homoserinibacter sp. YIM 151385]|uniref:acyltransferase family protein n=1 Tax=Homoserinibacter sp. YIM 151385 TaxID=2985506 RepID=UPI0022F04C1E|nr:acyltransferase family protein [Homoserinibacter sp. YIM 151385]WBU37789.1 acyltransferase family protein [Homoserinibacter sp. YIM 151385]
MTAARAGFRPDIQGLRALAVLLVLVFHAGAPWLPGGYLGVDVFFVISGFLIGGQLLDALRERGRVDLLSFYGRRARRILPAALVVILATVAGAGLLAPPLRLPAILEDALWSTLSAANLRFAIEQTDYLGETAPSPLQHLWSLGVEEQFYLLWPLLLVGFAALAVRLAGGRAGRRAVLIGAGIGLLTVLSFAAMLLVGAGSPVAFFSLPTRAWELALGTLAAALAAHAPRIPAHARAALGWGSLALVAASALLLGGPAVPEGLGAHPGPLTLVPVLATAVLLWSGSAPAAGDARLVLARRPAGWVGERSYALYLVHWPLLVLAQERAGLAQPLPGWAPWLLALAAVPLAWLLHRLVEVPTSARSRIGRWRPRRTLAAAAAAIAVLAGGVGISAPAIAAMPLDAGRPLAASPPQSPPLATAFVPSTLTPRLADAEADTGSLYRRGCQQSRAGSELLVCSTGPEDAARTVVVFGDSHAGRWFPGVEAALAGQDVRLVSLTKSGCRSIESEKLWSGATNRSCAAWRGAAVEEIARLAPDLVVLANHVGRDDRSPERVEEIWTGALASTLERLPAASRVLTIAETPSFPTSPLPCLSASLDDALACAAPRSDAVNEPVVRAERAASAAAGQGFVDLSDWMCTPELCPAIIGSTLAYTDEHHLSASFTASLAPALAPALERELAR